MAEIGIGIVGGGYMGKAHAVAMGAVGAVFATRLRPRLEMVCATSAESAERYRATYGFQRGTADWRELVHDPKVEAVIIASPQSTHRVQTPPRRSRGGSIAAGVTNMVGFNYIRTPASQFARKLIAQGAIGDITWFRGEHTEDFDADPETPATWRSKGISNGTMGDLAPHMINATLALAGPIASLTAEIETVHTSRPGPDGPEAVTNDDQAQIMCRFENGAMGHIFCSRVATGRKMGYIYEINGTKGAIRFDGEDQNALWLYRMEGPEASRGFAKILTGPEHPDYEAFCQGPGHGTGFQDQIIIEAKDFLEAIDSGEAVWPTFRDGLEVSRVVAAARAASETKGWVALDTI